MRKLLTPALAVLAISSASADINVSFPSPAPSGTVIVQRASIANLASARSKSDLRIVSDTVDISAKMDFVIPTPADGDYRFSVDFNSDNSADFYTRPGENLTLKVTQFNPIRYTVTGTALMDGMSEIMTAALPIEMEAKEIQEGKRPQSEMPGLFERFVKVYTDFIEKNPSSPAAVFAMLSLEPESFEKYEPMVLPTASGSALYPMFEQKRKSVKAQLEADRKRAEMEANHVEAPAFTLPDLNGKEVSLSDFRGKWVILDFWGSWCGWCIKGFPELKSAYEKYKPELEVIGIDCQETPERWRAGVEKHQLPWVHVYLSKEKQDALLSAYGVQGFPTKIIVNPEGKIMNITSGEDPSFYETLAKLMGK